MPQKLWIDLCLLKGPEFVSKTMRKKKTSRPHGFTGEFHQIFLKFFFNVYLFLGQRETEHERGGAEREGDTELETGSRL